MAKTIGQILPAGDEAARETAARLLRRGALVALPTETVYGLGADATQGSAVRAIYAAKGRPAYNPLICHVDGPEMARRHVIVPEAADRLMKHFWPGPLTLVLKRRPDSTIAGEVTAGLDTLAVRCPDVSAARDVIRRLGRPVAAPSANLSGHVSPTTPAHVSEDMLTGVALILDAGPTRLGIESTIVGIDDAGVSLLRPGSITAEQIMDTTGMPLQQQDRHAAPDRGQTPPVTAPGQLASHYAPSAAVRLNTTAPAPGRVRIGFGRSSGDFNLSPDGDLREAAANLFAMLRAADARLGAGATGEIAIAPIPAEGIGIAINDRLSRAAAPKDTRQDEERDMADTAPDNGTGISTP